MGSVCFQLWGHCLGRRQGAGSTVAPSLCAHSSRTQDRRPQVSAWQTPCSPPEPNTGGKAWGEPRKLTSLPPPELVYKLGSWPHGAAEEASKEASGGLRAEAATSCVQAPKSRPAVSFVKIFL